jgi:hypothetical protein
MRLVWLSHHPVCHGGPPRLCRSSVWSWRYVSRASASLTSPSSTSCQNKFKVRCPGVLVRADQRMSASSSSLANRKDLRDAMAIDADSPASSLRALAPSEWRQARSSGWRDWSRMASSNSSSLRDSTVSSGGERASSSSRPWTAASARLARPEPLSAWSAWRWSAALMLRSSLGSSAYCPWTPSVTKMVPPVAAMRWRVMLVTAKLSATDASISMRGPFIARGWRMRHPPGLAVPCVRRQQVEDEPEAGGSPLCWCREPPLGRWE